MNIAEAVRIIADKWHPLGTQPFRKYTGEPYTVHTKEVAEIYAGYFPGDVIGKAIAEGHDILEDTPLKNPVKLGDEIKAVMEGAGKFSEVGEVVYGIVCLTDVYTSEAYPDDSRARRKELERSKLSLIPAREQNIKICDLLSNTDSIAAHDANFARVYLREKEELLRVLNKADDRLRERAYRQLIGALTQVAR